MITVTTEGAGVTAVGVGVTTMGGGVAGGQVRVR